MRIHKLDADAAVQRLPQPVHPLKRVLQHLQGQIAGRAQRFVRSGSSAARWITSVQKHRCTEGEHQCSTRT